MDDVGCWGGGGLAAFGEKESERAWASGTAQGARRKCVFPKKDEEKKKQARGSRMMHQVGFWVAICAVSLDGRATWRSKRKTIFNSKTWPFRVSTQNPHTCPRGMACIGGFQIEQKTNNGKRTMPVSLALSRSTFRPQILLA